MLRVAFLSLHTSPLAQPGSGDSGGMNVYVRELTAALAQAGHDVTTFVRATSPDQPEVVEVEPGCRVVHVRAGAFDLPKEGLPGVVDQFADRVAEHLRGDFPADVVHANYWLSAVAAHRLKHELRVPFVTTFHTLGRIKAAGGDDEPDARLQAEDAVVGCSDAVCVSCREEGQQFRQWYGDPPGVVEIVAPGVEHAFFAPGEQRGARWALGLDADAPTLLFVGRIQPLKGAELAIGALAELRADTRLLLVGGASGTEGQAEFARLVALAQSLGVADRVQFVEPQPHHILSTYYRAADVVVVPSRSESFGLVALEAAACGTPVVAAAVGGLLSLVDHGQTGFLVAERTPSAYARAIGSLFDDPAGAVAMGHRAHQRAQRYTWSFAAARLRRLYADVTSAARLVSCS